MNDYNESLSGNESSEIETSTGRPDSKILKKINFGYSMKNIATPNEDHYLKSLIIRTEDLIKRMRWKIFFYENDDINNEDEENCETFGFRTHKTAPQSQDLTPFEDDLYNLIVNIKFRNNSNEFQKQLARDIKRINESNSVIVAADKTTNFYEIPKEQYNKMMTDTVTSQYCKSQNENVENTNKKSAVLARAVKIEDRAQCFSTERCFLTVKDHKENFLSKPTTRLINPAKTDLGKVSKSILDRINGVVRSNSGLNQWKITADVLDWFQDISKKKAKFLQFDIESYYPSITEDMLLLSLNFAKQYTEISDTEMEIMVHAKRSLLFTPDGTSWQKKDSPFDVTMGSNDGAETCEIVGLYLLSKIQEIIPSSQVGLYRDDGLAVITNSNGPKIDGIRKKLHRLFKKVGLGIDIQCNMEVVNFLDVTLDLATSSFQPYKKPNNSILYINNQSNHPNCIKNNIPTMVNKRLSQLSSNEEAFNTAKWDYEEALARSGYENNKLSFDKTNREDGDKNTDSKKKRRRRRRKVIWFNPPFSNNVETNIGRKFLSLLDKHFPKSSKYHKLFNRNNTKISYSCMPNIGQVIKGHNKTVLAQKEKKSPDGKKLCNCRKKSDCPLNNKCLTPCIVYRANVKSEGQVHTYIGLTEGTFKKRHANHKSSFSHEYLRLSSELSKKIWTLKDENKTFIISWDIIRKAQPRKPGQKTCSLCNYEKLAIVKELRSGNKNLLNKRSEIVSKCRHINKFLLKSC